MASGPAPFSEIGKTAKDLLTKDYCFEHRFTLSMLRNGGLGIVATGVKFDMLFNGDITTHYKTGETTVTVKVDGQSNISTTITKDELLPRTKASLRLGVPDQKSGKLDIQYRHDHAALTSSIGLTSVPLLEFSAAIGNKDLSLGGEIGFDSATASFTKYNAGVGMNNDDLSTSLILADKGETLKASYIHVINPTKGTAWAAEMTHRFSTLENTFTIGSSHILDPLTLVKTRFSNNGKVALLCQHEWRPKSLVTLSAEYDPKAATKPARMGLTVALMP